MGTTIPLADGLKRTIDYFDVFPKGGNDRIKSNPGEKLAPRTIGACKS
jgi:hypothetical protein